MKSIGRVEVPRTRSSPPCARRLMRSRRTAAPSPRGLALGSLECQTAEGPCSTTARPPSSSAVVQEYIATAPSRWARRTSPTRPACNVSSATVRNEMAVLEQEGYLIQPHTSAGRVPTDKGYRFFVDNLASPGRLDDATQRRCGVLPQRPRRLEEMLHDTLGPAGPPHELRRRGGRTPGRVGRRPQRAARRAVADAGHRRGRARQRQRREQHHSTWPTTSPTSTWPPRRRTSRRTLVGSSLAAAPEVAAVAATPSSTASPPTPCSAVRDRPGERAQLYVGGTSTMASAFDAVEIVRDVLHTLEQQFVVVSLLGDLVQRGLSVAIGVEHGVEPLSACSVVVAPIIVDGEQRGTVGVLGPTRMNYPHALATVDVVSDQLGRRWDSDGGEADDERWPTTTSCSVSPGRDGRRDQAGVPPQGARAAPRRQPRRRRGLRARSRRSPGPTRCCPTPTSGPATTTSARPASAGPGRPARGRVPRRRAGRPLRRLLRRAEPVRRRPARRGPAGPPRGQDLEVVADISFEQAVFGATRAGVAEAAASAATTATAAAPVPGT